MNSCGPALRTLATAACWTALSVCAAPAEKPQLPAGPAPSAAAAKAAVFKYLQSKDSSLDARKPFKLLSGPTLATGNTLAGNLEQAWLMCVLVDAKKREPGPRAIEGKAVYLRNLHGVVQVVLTDTWKDSSPQC